MLEAGFEANGLLKRLEPSVRIQFQMQFQPVELCRGDTLHSPGQKVDRIYFPIAGLVAVLSETLAGESVQTGMIGCDGAVGVAEARGSAQPLAKSVVQVPGRAMRLSAEVYRGLYDASPRLRASVDRYIEMLLADARQSVVCNALHPVEARLSRAILQALDRSCLERVLPLTQEALAQMLGSQRTTVAAFLSKMQRAGLVSSGRGTIEVQNRAALERMSCSCRPTLEFARREIQAAVGAPLHHWSASPGDDWRDAPPRTARLS
ncbi:MAG TPA: Crp/Fnr family transcriptional regulator, partial [Phenylobacterium sp.]|uniref:Crp/Fnr family transcriptional regulator n=1 Tax=Phenylobacterium sp. TaxID=1871053 RepID=UPI002D3FA236